MEMDSVDIVNVFQTNVFIVYKNKIVKKAHFFEYPIYSVPLAV